ESRRRNVITRKGIIWTLYVRLTKFVLRQSFPTAWSAGVRQVIQSGVIGMISVWSAVRVDGHTGFKEKRVTTGHSQNGNFALRISHMIHLEIQNLLGAA